MCTTPNFIKACLVALFAVTLAHAQITPLGDSYTNTADPNTNYGARMLLNVDGATRITYIQFDLASIPATACISSATLKLFVNAVTTAGSFNVDYVNGTWAESTIDAGNAPALGKTIASDVSITTADKNQYILINVTPAVEAWLSGGETNNGIALVANSSFNATFDSKENTATSHPAELDIVFAAHGGDGTITGVTAGADLTGGGTSGNVTLNLDTTRVPLLAAANTFTGKQTINNNVSILGSGSGSALSVSGATTGVTGQTVTNGGSGLYGVDSSATGGSAVSGVSTNGTGVYGFATASSGNTVGVYGSTNSPNGVGVYGANTVEGAFSAGVYGFSSVQDGAGVEAVNTNSEGNGLVVSATGPDGYGGVIQGGLYGVIASGSGNEPGTVGVTASGSSYGVYSDGNFAVAAGYTKSGVAVLPDDRAVMLYSMESPENWYEDFGSGKLQNGSATIRLDPTYAETVNTTIEYHVFLTPNGDCAGLYVAQKTPTAFEVRELRGGKSSVAFDYRIVAKRLGLENLRLEVISTDHEQAETMRQHLASRPLHPPVLKRGRKPPQPAFFTPPKPQLPKTSQQASVPALPRAKSPVSQHDVALPESQR
jgi:hypothetical protein